ncbi:MAG: response regulator [Chloroflexi bacterium]|nr:response regulator [Chloroflexota bacterium]
MEKIRVLIIDEHPAVRRALKTLLDSSPEIAVMAVVDGIVEGEKLAQLIQPDVILLGLKSHVDNAAASFSQAVSRINKLGSAILILSPYPDDVEQEMFYQAGASDYLLKDINSPQLIASIRQAIPSSEAHING